MAGYNRRGLGAGFFAPPFVSPYAPYARSKPQPPPEPAGPKSEFAMIYGWQMPSPKVAALAMATVDGEDLDEIRSGDFDPGVYDSFAVTEYPVGEDMYRFQVQNWDKPPSQWIVYLAVDLGTDVDAERLEELIGNTKDALNPEHDLFKALQAAFPNGVGDPRLQLRKIVKDW